MDQVRRNRLAQNEGSFRSINEDLEEGLHKVRLEDEELVGFVCECSSRECSQLVHIELPKYQEIRENSRRFLVVPGHESPEVEDVVESGQGYNVVQKHDDVTEVVQRGDRRHPAH